VRLARWTEGVTSSRPGGVAATDWSLYVSESRRLSLQTKDRETGNAHAPLMLTDSCLAHYLIMWEDGLVSRGRMERRELEEWVAGSLSAARAAAYDDPDAACVLGPAEFPRVRLEDESIARAVAGETTPLVERWRLVDEKVRDGGFRTWSGSIHVSETESRVVTSRGLDVASRGTSLTWFVSVDGEIGAGHTARAFEPLIQYSTRLDRLMDHARRLREPGIPIPGGVRDVVLHPEVVETLVLGTLLHHLDGATVAHGEGRFRREGFVSGNRVLRDDFTLRLDPLIPLRSGSYRFTHEGLPAATCVYVERGCLITPVAGLKYARRLGMKPTPIPYALDTLFLEGPEPLSEGDAFAAAAGGALVLSVLGVHTLDAASGDFSLFAPQVLRLSPSGPKGRLRATISGNLFALLSSESLRLVRFQGEHVPGLWVRCRLDPR